MRQYFSAALLPVGLGFHGSDPAFTVSINQQVGSVQSCWSGWICAWQKTPEIEAKSERTDRGEFGRKDFERSVSPHPDPLPLGEGTAKV
jgi:hypothetical protein